MEELRSKLIEFLDWYQSGDYDLVIGEPPQIVDQWLSINDHEPTREPLNENKEVKSGCKKGKLCHCTWITQKMNCAFNKNS